MQNHYAEAAIFAMMANKRQVLERILASQPGMLKVSWSRIMSILGVLHDVDIEGCLRVLLPIMRSRFVQIKLDHPIDADDNSILHWLALWGDADKLATFRRLEANLGRPNRFGTTPLFDAVRGGFPKVIEAIADEDPRALRHRNAYDCSPMHWACKHCSLPGAETLHRLDPGLINLPNSRGFLPLDVLQWHRLYFSDKVLQVHKRWPVVDEIRTYEEMERWLIGKGAVNSEIWVVIPWHEKLRRGNAPFDAELWWRFVQPPAAW